MSNSPSVQTLKSLFSLSSNRCAFPDCLTRIVDPATGTLTGEVCHIKARRQGEPRFDPAQNDDDRHAFENLLILCSAHHTIIDDDDELYTVSRLSEMKRAHERRSQGPIGADSNVVGHLVAGVQNELALNRIFLDSVQFPFRKVELPNGNVAEIVDGALLPFLIEELLSLSATKIVVEKDSMLGYFMNRSPAFLTEFVEIVDFPSLHEKWINLAQPIVEEFGVFILNGVAAQVVESDTQLHGEAMAVFSSLRKLLFAMECRCQISINMEELASFAAKLREFSKRAASRAILSVIEGAFRLYRPEHVPCLVVKPAAFTNHANLLANLLKSRQYSQLSSQAIGLGRPRQQDETIAAMSSSVREIADGANAAIDAASGTMPINLGKSSADELMQLDVIRPTKFMPPLVNFDHAILRAKARWQQESPDHVPPPGIMEQLKRWFGA